MGLMLMFVLRNLEGHHAHSHRRRMVVALSAALQRAHELTRATSQANNEFFNLSAKHTRSACSCSAPCTVCYWPHLI